MLKPALMKNSILFLAYVCIAILPGHAFSFAFSDLVDQTAVGPMLKEKPIHQYTPTIGSASRITGLGIDEIQNLSTTNRNLFLIGLDVDGSSSTFSLPYKDPKQSTEARVDSNLFSAGLSLKFSPHIRGEINYDYAKGYLVQEDQTKPPTYLFPDLSYTNLEIATHYQSNPNHSSFLFSPILFKRSQSSSSWIYGASINRRTVGGIGSVQKYKAFDRKSNLHDADIDSISPSIAYSHTHFFSHWFVGGAAGMSYNFSTYRKRYTTQETKLDDETTASALINIAFGYTWTQLTTGFFATTQSWYANLDEFHVTNSQGKIGYYFSYVF